MSKQKVFSSEMSHSDLTVQISSHNELESSQWMRLALRYFGATEVAGSKSNPLIVQFIANAIGGVYRGQSTQGTFLEVNERSPLPLVCSLGYDFYRKTGRGRRGRHLDEAVMHWCSAFVNHVMITSGYRGTKSLAARSWHRWGKKINKAEVDHFFGAIAVFTRPSKSNPNAGHVGFYVGESKHSYLILGGNQNDSVCVKKYRKSRLLSFRWPD